MRKLYEMMLGVTMSSVTIDGNREEMVFSAEDGRRFRFFHEQECCENVRIEDVSGDLSDLVGSPLLLAEEVSSEGAAPPDGTWTFYKFATVKGSVTVRWLGISNGYYSEAVELEVSR